MQNIERFVEVLENQRQEVIRHVTVPQDQEVIRQVTIIPRWCLALADDPTEYKSVVSDTGYSWNPSTMLSRRNCVPQISHTHVNRSFTKD